MPKYKYIKFQNPILTEVIACTDGGAENGQRKSQPEFNPCYHPGYCDICSGTFNLNNNKLFN